MKEDEAPITKPDDVKGHIPEIPLIDGDLPTLNACPIKVSIRDKPSKNIPVLTTYYNKKTEKWHESTTSSHPSSL